MNSPSNESSPPLGGDGVSAGTYAHTDALERTAHENVSSVRMMRHAVRPRFALERMKHSRHISPLEIFEEVREFQKEDMDAEHCREHGIFWKSHPECSRCSHQDRSYIRDVRQIAIDYPNIFSWTYLDPQIFSEIWAWPSPKDAGMVLLAISVQVFAPLAISLQLYDELVEEDENGIAGSLCPHNSDRYAGPGKFLAFVLSTLFGVVSVANFLGKVRGNTFLLLFSPLTKTRSSVIVLGLVSQVVGLIAANVAEYLLFCSRGSNNFLLLLFTSLTMQSTLNADSVFISETKRNESAALVLTFASDDALGVNSSGDSMPKPLSELVHKFRMIFLVASMVMASFSLFLTVAVTYCI